MVPNLTQAQAIVIVVLVALAGGRGCDAQEIRADDGNLVMALCLNCSLQVERKQNITIAPGFFEVTATTDTLVSQTEISAMIATALQPLQQTVASLQQALDELSLTSQTQATMLATLALNVTSALSLEQQRTLAAEASTATTDASLAQSIALEASRAFTMESSSTSQMSGSIANEVVHHTTCGFFYSCSLPLGLPHAQF